MRLIGMVLSLGVIIWVMVQAAGGGSNDTVISRGHQDALEKAKHVEQTVQDSFQEQFSVLENTQ